MTVTEVNIMPVKPKDGLVAFASVVINDSIYLNSIAIYVKKLDGSYRLLYPNKLVGERSMSLFYPINRESSAAIERAIFAKCHELFEKSDENYGHNNIGDRPPTAL